MTTTVYHPTIRTEEVRRDGRRGHRFECPVCTRRLLLWADPPGLEIEDPGDPDALHGGSIGGVSIETQIVSPET